MTDKTQQKLTLSEKQLRAIPIILGAKNIKEGAAKAKISRETFYEWIKDAVFKAEFERQRQEIIDGALHELKLTAGESVKVLRELLKSKEDSIKLRTATALLDYIQKFMEIEDIQTRLETLERKADENRDQKKTRHA